MNASVERGLLLYQQHRFADAERAYREGLASDPENPTLHAMLSLTLLRQEKFEDAEQEAELAVRSEPDDPLGHYAMAATLFERNRDDAARDAIGTAISLDQMNPNFHGLLANIYLRKSLWRMALNAADTGLRFDPQHSTCINARATALVKLGLRDEAAETMQDALANDPEDAHLHANQGWALLHQGKPKLAMEHFRESLRLDPTDEWAKAGVVESLKASFFLYRWLLAYFLWMSRLTPRAQMGIIFGGFIGSRILRVLAQDNSSLAPWVMPIIFAYGAFAILTWLAPALFNLLLRLHPAGKYALGSDQKRASEVVAGLLGATLVAVLLALFTEHHDQFGALAVGLFITALPASAIFNCARGWPRWAMTGLTLVVLLLGVYQSLNLSSGAFSLFLVVAIASQFIASSLSSVRPRR